MKNEKKKDFEKVTLTDIAVGATLGIFAMSMVWFSSTLLIHIVR